MPLPTALADWAAARSRCRIGGREAEWSDAGDLCRAAAAGRRRLGEHRPQAAARRATNVTDRGWISYLNDLHKGRNTGAAWSLFLDVFAVACVVFCLTGLVLLQLLSNGRPSTWPLVGLGFVIPDADRNLLHPLRRAMRAFVSLTLSGAHGRARASPPR